MELQYFGGNCLKITNKKVSIVIDDNLTELGAKNITKEGDVVLFTYGQPNPDLKARMVITDPGEYEIEEVSIKGLASRAHTDPEDKHTATIFKVTVDDVRLAVLGHIWGELNDQQLETLGTVDVLVVPIGGGGFTLDGHEALKLINKIEPKVIIPTYFAGAGLKYPTLVDEPEESFKALGMEPAERVPKLKLKVGEFSEDTKLIVLERQ